jgi:hypothetical protein
LFLRFLFFVFCFVVLILVFFFAFRAGLLLGFSRLASPSSFLYTSAALRTFSLLSPGVS